MPADEILDSLSGGEFDLPTAWSKQLDDELTEAEKDTVLLSKFSGSRAEHEQLASSIREQQRRAERLIERLRTTNTDTSEHEQRTKKLQRSFRSALLQYRPNTRAQAQQERNLLLSGAATPAELRKKKVRTGNAALNAAADVTTALQETVSMMSDEIEKSAGNISAMSESSNKLRKTKGQYLAMDDVLKVSKNLVRTLEQADTVDRWLMLFGLVLFSLVAFNILRKRVWIPGLYTAFRVIRYVVTMGFSSSSSGSSTAESPHVVSEFVTELVHATTSLSSTTTALMVASAASTGVTMTLGPSLLPVEGVQPSVEVLDTLATTSFGSSFTEQVIKSGDITSSSLGEDNSSSLSEDNSSSLSEDNSGDSKPSNDNTDNKSSEDTTGDNKPSEDTNDSKPEQKPPNVKANPKKLLPGAVQPNLRRRYHLPVERPKHKEL
ncbi:Vesicle transport protein S20 [Coemansia sp. RSA 2167]|nr:Vesicle transport protein S20 [Coemansia sp. RSA 2167]KAJ2154607.1 Vesicle transport protein S20 [Coemansia sp. RSA 637]KAJ2409201.1 Vesicle transport protein S20 [Coemansia sp. RSA 2526]KAJ2530687.1 Vesicle transport protein S20 [Coemansia sp. RSA 1937]KAJ2537282.1 Vesicle transport protein S20 [Coemansia sp. RSA 1935]KAJ2594034.1 Vesicle transport protein S20 [Coemansia sp. RSA 1797]